MQQLRQRVFSMIEESNTQTAEYDELVHELVRRPPLYPSLMQAICDKWEARAERRRERKRLRGTTTQTESSPPQTTDDDGNVQRDGP